jgi:hypothetical protein
MSNLPDDTGNQPSEFIDEPENTPGDHDAPPATPKEQVPPEDQSDG